MMNVEMIVTHNESGTEVRGDCNSMDDIRQLCADALAEMLGVDSDHLFSVLANISGEKPEHFTLDHIDLSCFTIAYNDGDGDTYDMNGSQLETFFASDIDDEQLLKAIINYGSGQINNWLPTLENNDYYVSTPRDEVEDKLAAEMGEWPIWLVDAIDYSKAFRNLGYTYTVLETGSMGSELDADTDIVIWTD